MKSNVTALRASQGPGDPLRDQLAGAIEAQRQAEDAVARHHEAIGRARDLAAAATARLEKARAALDAERKRKARAIGEAARRGIAPAASAALRGARLAEADAADEQEAAAAALATLEAENIGEAAAVAAAAIIAACNGVVAEEATRLLGEMAAARSRCLALAQAVTALTMSDDDLPRIDDVVTRLRANEAAEAPLHQIRQQAAPLLHNGPAIADEAEREEMLQVGRSWWAWRRELRMNPSAPPPEAP